MWNKSTNQSNVAWENANLAYNIDIKNADILVKQAKKYLSREEPNISEETKKERQNISDLIDRFKDARITTATFIWEGNRVQLAMNEDSAMSIGLSRLHPDLIQFAKDFKVGFATENPQIDSYNVQEEFKNSSLDEILKSGNKIGQMLKSELSQKHINKRSVQQATDFIKSLDISTTNITGNIESPKNELKLVGKFQDNAGFKTLAKNLTGNEAVYIYFGDDILSKFINNALEANTAVISFSINANGISAHLYAKNTSAITNENEEKAQKITKELEENVKWFFNVYFGLVFPKVQNEEDKKFISDAIESIKSEYKKTGDTTYQISVSLTADLEKVVDTFEKTNSQE